MTFNLNIIYYIKIYLVSLIFFLGIDIIWLTKVAPGFYKSNIGHLMAEKPNLWAAVAFYLFNLIGIIIFAVSPSLKNNSLRSAIILGALYGFFTYATYDLTNYATLKNWPITVVIIDILWRMILTSVVSLITYLIGIKYL
ncbi:DUF2177 family protein [Patescibacteria group bacterium]|nr:DUF2177 family protein [Patescibacteria group bacterium]